jgi:hypothetical protein
MITETNNITHGIIAVTIKFEENTKWGTLTNTKAGKEIYITYRLSTCAVLSGNLFVLFKTNPMIIKHKIMIKLSIYRIDNNYKRRIVLKRLDHCLQNSFKTTD